MNKDSFEPSKALKRPKPKKSNKNTFSDAELAQSPWGNFALFLNESYPIFIPKNEQKQRRQKAIADIHKTCIEQIKNTKLLVWEDMLEKSNFYDYEYKEAETFCFHLSKKYSENLPIFKKNWSENMSKFVALFAMSLNTKEEPDLVKLGELADLIDQFNKSSQRTFWFLEQLPNYLDEYSQKILLSSVGYQEIIKFGANQYLDKFALQLQKKFSLTRTALKDKAAQNLVQELGETETNLKNEIQLLELENQELKNNLETFKKSASQEAILNLAHSLQNNQQQPVLDQIFRLYQRLKNLVAANQGLSSQDTLTCLITLESLLEGLKSLNITRFPTNINEIFEITGHDLDTNKYNYVSGSQFISQEDTKQVRCVTPGWRLGEQIITPAKVEEVTKFN